jgi:hypothetical protein
MLERAVASLCYRIPGCFQQGRGKVLLCAHSYTTRMGCGCSLLCENPETWETKETSFVGKVVPHFRSRSPQQDASGQWFEMRSREVGKLVAQPWKMRWLQRLLERTSISLLLQRTIGVARRLRGDHTTPFPSLWLVSPSVQPVAAGLHPVPRRVPKRGSVSTGGSLLSRTPRGEWREAKGPLGLTFLHCCRCRAECPDERGGEEFLASLRCRHLSPP